MGEHKRNPRSVWSRNKAKQTEMLISTQTTDKKNLVTTPIHSGSGEPIVMELTLKNIWGYLCRSLKVSKQTNLVQTS